MAVPYVWIMNWWWRRWCLLYVDGRWWLLGSLEAQAVFPCGLTCESGGSGNVDRAMLAEGLSELLSKLRYLLLSDGSNGGNQCAQAQVHRGAWR